VQARHALAATVPGSLAGRCRLGLVSLAFVCLLGTFGGSIAPAVAAPCPNEAFRTGASAALPDCRAYEQVTPPYKNGSLVSLTAPPSGGSFVVGNSLGIFAESAASSPFAEGNAYSFTRSPSGWVAEAVEPPVAQFDPAFGGEEAEVDPVAGSVLLVLRPTGAPKNEADLYLRTRDGALKEIGPMLPSSALPPAPVEGEAENLSQQSVGASDDLSHVLFMSSWPKGGTSLYEYVGTGNTEPILVGVNNEGHQISSCATHLGGTVLGAPGSIDNAVSADGSKVFFTAAACSPGPPVDEVYARISGSTTVSISEPSAADCASCNTGEPAEATFEGASSDGSKVFFITAQALLPSDTDTSPDLYEYDFDAPGGDHVSQLTTGVGSGSGLQGVGSISADGSHAYFIATGVLTSQPNGFDQLPLEGEDNLYVSGQDAEHPASQPHFVATLSPEDAEQWDLGAPRMQSTPDGRFLIFTSFADLTPDDISTAKQLFRYDSQSGDLVRVSIGEGGYNNNGNTNIAGLTVPTPAFREISRKGANTNPAISDDGSVVVFQSPVGLTPTALDNRKGVINAKAQNVYEYEDGHVYLISDGRDIIRTNLLGLDHSGRDIYFNTSSRLVAQDTDTTRDLYDARVEGGFPPPGPSIGCAEEACQAQIPSPPTVAPPTSASYSGAGNLTVRHKKKHHRHKRAHHKRAGRANREASR
jgi:hypothetical protein